MKRSRLMLLPGVLLAAAAATFLIVYSRYEADRQPNVQNEWRSTVDNIVSFSLVGRWDEEAFQPDELKVAIEALRHATLVGRGEYHGTGRWVLEAASSDGTTTRWRILDDGENTLVYVDGYEMQVQGLSGVIDSVSTRMRH